MGYTLSASERASRVAQSSRQGGGLHGYVPLGANRVVPFGSTNWSHEIPEPRPMQSASVRAQRRGVRALWSRAVTWYFNLREPSVHELGEQIRLGRTYRHESYGYRVGSPSTPDRTTSLLAQLPPAPLEAGAVAPILSEAELSVKSSTQEDAPYPSSPLALELAATVDLITPITLEPSTPPAVSAKVVRVLEQDQPLEVGQGLEAADTDVSKIPTQPLPEVISVPDEADGIIARALVAPDVAERVHFAPFARRFEAALADVALIPPSQSLFSPRLNGHADTVPLGATPGAVRQALQKAAIQLGIVEERQKRTKGDRRQEVRRVAQDDASLDNPDTTDPAYEIVSDLRRLLRSSRNSRYSRLSGLRMNLAQMGFVRGNIFDYNPKK